MQVARARELRNIVTSLGPAYIKLGQALSIRPDILSPAAMVELQKLCDKVPSFDDRIAMDVIEEELGAPWQQVKFSCQSIDSGSRVLFKYRCVYNPVSEMEILNVLQFSSVFFAFEQLRSCSYLH